MTLLQWPENVSTTGVSAQAKESFFKNLSYTPISSRFPGRDYLRDGLAICKLQATDGRYQPILNTVEVAGYNTPDDIYQENAGKMVGTAVGTLCTKYKDRFIAQASAISRDFIADQRAAAGKH
jgi:hypothetical protein